MKKKILYSITTDDLVNVSNEEKISFDTKDISFIGEKIGDYFGDKWHDAIEYALMETKKK